jgi:SAM-dependent methyltransferase
MSAILRIAKNIYHTVAPRFICESPLVAKLKGLVGHNIIYDSGYYDHTVEGPAVRSAGTISDSIVAEFGPKRVIDVGCGTGALLEALREKGCEVFGLEYSNAALKYCRARQLNVTKFDIEKDVFSDNRTFDIAISTEVAEHLPEKVSDRYIDLLTRLAHIIIFTAAPPDQGGRDHVNEQPPSYWISKYKQRGFEHDEELSNSWKESWKAAGSVRSFYYQNLMILRKIQ